MREVHRSGGERQQLILHSGSVSLGLLPWAVEPPGEGGPLAGRVSHFFPRVCDANQPCNLSTEPVVRRRGDVTLPPLA